MNANFLSGNTALRPLRCCPPRYKKFALPRIDNYMNVVNKLSVWVEPTYVRGSGVPEKQHIGAFLRVAKTALRICIIFAPHIPQVIPTRWAQSAKP